MSISLLGVMVNEMTPKASVGEIAFTMRQRDYKEPMVVIYDVSESDNTESLGLTRESSDRQHWDLSND